MADRFELYYGPSGSSKSTAAARIAAQLHAETGKKTRAWVGDGSRATYEDMGLIAAGVVEVAAFGHRPWPLSVLKQMMQGWWPADCNDPWSPLQPPTPTSMKDLTLTIMEGVAMMGNYIMGDVKGGLAERAGRGEKIGQDSPIMLLDAERDENGLPIKGSGTGEVFGGNPLAHYNVAQRKLFTFIEMAKALPGWVIFTTHEKSAEDKLAKETIIGPEAVGGAMTANLSRQFNNTLHFDTAMKKAKQKDEHTGKMVDEADIEYRIYTRDHYDPDGGSFVKYRAVTRCPVPSMMPQFIAGDNPGDNIIKFYSILRDAQAEARKRMGLPSGKEAA